MKTEHTCLRAHCNRNLYRFDVVEVNGFEVEFLACVTCLVGYTISGTDMELIR